MTSGLAQQIDEITSKLIHATSERSVRWQLTDTPGVYRLDRDSGTILVSGPSTVVSVAIAAASLVGTHEIRILDKAGDVIAVADDSMHLMQYPGTPARASRQLIQQLYEVVHHQVTGAKPELDELIQELDQEDEQ